MERMPTLIRRSIPQLARVAIEEMSRVPDLSPETRAVLKRLETRDEMTEVWEKLPAEHLGDFVRRALLAFAAAMALEPPRPKEANALAAHLKRYPPRLTYSTLAGLARWLLEGMVETPSYQRELWATFAPCDSQISFDQLLTQLETVAKFYEGLDEGHRSWLASLALPINPGKPGSESMRQVYFSRAMSSWLIDHCRRPYDEIVAILETVIFNLPSGEVTCETIRGRRRQLPENSGRTPR
jgi:hypothetical protein